MFQEELTRRKNLMKSSKKDQEKLNEDVMSGLMQIEDKNGH
jgi:hypothetical protein